MPEKQEATLGGPSRTGRWARALLYLSGEQLRGSWGRTRGPGSTHCPWPGNQKPSALLRLHLLLEGEGQPLQPHDDLLHPPRPPGAAERHSGLQGGPYYIAPRRPLKGQALRGPSIPPPRRAAPPRPAVSRSCPTQGRRARGPTPHPGNTRPVPDARCWVGTSEPPLPATARLQTPKHAASPNLCSGDFVGVFGPAPGLGCNVWDLVPRPGIEPRPPASGAQSLSHWAAREVPAGSHFSREGTAAGVSCEESCTSQPQRGRPNAQIHRSWRSLGAGGRRGGARVREGGARVRRDQAHPPSQPQLPYHRAPARGDP